MSFKITSDLVAGGAYVQAAPFSTYPASDGLTQVVYFKALAANFMPDLLLSLCDYNSSAQAGWFTRLTGSDPAMLPSALSYNNNGSVNGALNSATDVASSIVTTWHCLISVWRNDGGTRKVQLHWGPVGGALTSETEASLSAHTISGVDTCFIGNWRTGNANGGGSTARGWLAHAAVFDTPITDTGIITEFLTYTPEAVAYNNSLDGNLAVYWELLDDLNAHADFGGSTYNLTPVGVNYISGDADNPSLTEWSGGAAADSYLLVPRRQWFVPRTVIQY